MSLSFERWLFNQMGREDPIGMLAHAMSEVDLSKVHPQRRADEHKKWADIVTRYGKSEHVLAFNQAWREYQVARQASTLPE